jgi:hypothetical protein
LNITIYHSCKKNGKDIVVLGYGEKLNPEDIICIVDGYRVISVRNLEHLPDIFNQFL